MGRYYWGDIEGKFWVGIQSSTDISQLISCNYTEIHEWEGCNCDIYEDDIFICCDDDCDEDCQHIYCKECFTNKEEHIKSILEENEDYQEGEPLYREMNYILYDIDCDNHLKDLQNSLDILRKNIRSDILDEYNKIENNDRIIDTGSGVFAGIDDILNDIENNENSSEKNKDEAISIARYGLGLQIKYVLKNKGSCAVYCEY